MSIKTGAIPKGGARSKNEVRKEINGLKQQEEETSDTDPLDKKFIISKNAGVERRVPALHIGWAEKCTYVRYENPPSPDDDGVIPPGATEAWLEQMEFLEQDLQNLLNLPHHKFWSQVVYDESVHQSLESYITIGPRWYDDEALDTVSKPIVENIHHMVFLVYVRMATYKESRTCHITPAVFGEIIYENFLFDACKLLDLCILYGPTNPTLLAKMINNIFTQQPNYYQDLTHITSTIGFALEKVEEKLGVSENTARVAGQDNSTSLSDLQDIILYLLDTFSSIQALLAVFPPAAEVFHKAEFEIRLAGSYESIVPVLMERLSEHSWDPEQQMWTNKLLSLMQQVRSSALLTFRHTVNNTCIQPLLGERDNNAQVDHAARHSFTSECLEKFLHIMSSAIGEKTFIADYCQAYPFSRDKEIFAKHCKDVTSLNFISEAIDMVMTELGVTKSMKDLTVSEKLQKTKDEMTLDTSGMNGYAEAESGTVLTPVALASMVSTVQDLLPDLGAGFIHECLRYYSHSTEEVINALLEDNLPPALLELDRSAPLKESPIEPDIPQTTSHVKESSPQSTTESMEIDMLSTRANIYDNDKFDVFSSNKSIDKDNIRRGKKKNDYDEDEAAIEKTRELLRQYEERGGTSIYEDEFRYDGEVVDGGEYDDEYDDTYDDNDATGIDDFQPDRRKKPGGVVITGTAGGSRIEEDIEEEDEEEGNIFRNPNRKGESLQDYRNNSSPSYGGRDSWKQRSPDYGNGDNEENDGRPKLSFTQFCANPEDTRAKAAQRRAEKMKRWGVGGKSRGPMPPPQPLPGGGDSIEASQGYDNPRGQDSRSGDVRQHDRGGDYGGGARPKMSSTNTKKSGKSWRSGEGDDDRGGSRGGKYKEDTNHGKAQDPNYRRKMQHKNEHKRAGAQAKFNRNN